MVTPLAAPPVHARLVEGLERIATALRADDWVRARSASVNPTQLAILRLLDIRHLGWTVKELSLQLGVSQPTVTDSILALERKALIEKRADPADGRAAAALGDGDQEAARVARVRHPPASGAGRHSHSAHVCELPAFPALCTCRCGAAASLQFRRRGLWPVGSADRLPRPRNRRSFRPGCHPGRVSEGSPSSRRMKKEMTKCTE